LRYESDSHYIETTVPTKKNYELDQKQQEVVFDETPPSISFPLYVLRSFPSIPLTLKPQIISDETLQLSGD